MMLNSVCMLGVRGATPLHLWLSPICDCPTVCERQSSAQLSWIWGTTLAHGQGPKFRSIS